MEINIEGIDRYFACTATGQCPQDYHLLTISPAQAKEIEANRQYKFYDIEMGTTEYQLESDDPVSDWAYHHLCKNYGDCGRTIFNFHELPRETGDRMQVMSNVISGRTTVEELEQENIIT